MIIQLTPSWILTDEHGASSYGQAVLVSLQSGEAYGPGDMVRCYPNWPFQPACEAVKRLGKLGSRTEEEKTGIEKFSGFEVKA